MTLCRANHSYQAVANRDCHQGRIVLLPCCPVTVSASYYRMVTVTKEESNNQPIISELKVESLKSLDKYYLASITQMHWVASYLEPSFKSFSFVVARVYLDKQRNEIHILTSELVSDSDCTHPSTQHLVNSPPSKQYRVDLFVQCRSQSSTTANPDV